MPPLSPVRQSSWTAVSIGSANTLRVLSGTKAPQPYGGHIPSLENTFRVWFDCIRRCWCFPGKGGRAGVVAVAMISSPWTDSFGISINSRTRAGDLVGGRVEGDGRHRQCEP